MKRPNYHHYLNTSTITFKAGVNHRARKSKTHAYDAHKIRCTLSIKRFGTTERIKAKIVLWSFQLFIRTELHSYTLNTWHTKRRKRSGEKTFLIPLFIFIIIILVSIWVAFTVYLFTAVARTKFYKYLLFVMLNDVLLFMHFISEVKAWVYNYCVLSLW